MAAEHIKYGNIGWIDLTVPNAVEVREFYSKVAGWKYSPIKMGEYDDFVMIPEDGSDAAAGICNARGTNEGMPSSWMIYINVKNIEQSISDCQSLGGKVIREIKTMGTYGKFAVISDPAGAVCALFEPVTA